MSPATSKLSKGDQLQVRRRNVLKTFAAAVSTLPALLGAPTSAQDIALKDCLQDDSARLALRACSALLQGNGLSKEDRAKAFASRGRAWLREEEPEEAVTDFTRVLEADPANAGILRERARAYTQLDNHKAAAADWTAIIASNTSADAPVLARAGSWLAAGDTAAALADYDLVLARNPKSVEARIDRGNVFVSLENKEQAYREFNLAEQADPGSWQVYHARGMAADKWGDTKLAIENYSKTLRINTVNWDARRALRRMGVINVP